MAAGWASPCRRGGRFGPRPDRSGDHDADGGALGRGLLGRSSIHLNIFGVMPIVKFGTQEQKQEFLPQIISGQQKMCFAVTEPNSGLDTSSLETRAERTNSGYASTAARSGRPTRSAPTRSC